MVKQSNKSNGEVKIMNNTNGEISVQSQGCYCHRCMRVHRFEMGCPQFCIVCGIQVPAFKVFAHAMARPLCGECYDVLVQAYGPVPVSGGHGVPALPPKP